MPSLTELEKLFANKAAINASLKALGVALLKGCCWSSTEYNSGSAWVLVMNYGNRTTNGKGSDYYVRPVLALKL